MCLKSILLVLSFFFSYANASEQNVFKLIDAGNLQSIKTLIEKDSKIVTTRNTADFTPLEYSLAMYSKDEISEYFSTYDQDYKSVLNNVMTNGKSDNVNYSKIWPDGIQVLLVGEMHADFVTIPNEIISMLKQLKKQGLTHFATEFQQSGLQTLIDNYQSGLIPIETIQEENKSKKRTRISLSDKDLTIIKEATKLGIKVLALDIATTLPGKLKGNIDERSDGGVNQRNDNWLKIIKETINKNPKTKILVYCGIGHSSYRIFGKTGTRILTITERLQQEKYKAYTIRTSRPDIKDLFQYAATKAKIVNNKFIIYPKDNYEKDYVYRSDAVLYLPVEEMFDPMESLDIVGGKECSSLQYYADFIDASKQCDSGSMQNCYKKGALARMYKCYDIAEATYSKFCLIGDNIKNKQIEPCYCLASVELKHGKYETIKKLCKEEKKDQEESAKRGIQLKAKMCDCYNNKENCDKAEQVCNIAAERSKTETIQ